MSPLLAHSSSSDSSTVNPLLAGSFFIKPGYVCNDHARTFEKDEGGEYWTQDRLRQAEVYQHAVYSFARRVARRRGLKSLLDVGCGPAVKVRSILVGVFARVTLIDQPTCRRLVESVVPWGRFVDADLESPGRLAETFELVICADVVEHLHNPVPCLELIRDCLAPGGVALISTPERDRLRGFACDRCPHEAHVREWNQKEFSMLLEHVGFRVGELRLTPPKRLPWIERPFASILHRWIQPARWTGCQLAVCSPN